MSIVIFFLPNEEISKVIKVAKMFLKPKLNIENILKPSFFELLCNQMYTKNIT